MRLSKRNPILSFSPSIFFIILLVVTGGSSSRSSSSSSSWCCFGFGVHPQLHYRQQSPAVSSLRPLLQTTETSHTDDTDDDANTVDVSIPYDAAAQLAYEAAGNPDNDYESFKEQYLAEAVADVIRKRNNNHKNEQKDQEMDNEQGKNADEYQEEEEEEEDLLLVESENDNERVVELQEKLRHWMEKEKKAEDNYRSYLVQKALDEKIPPIYTRERKIDHYKARPIYDKETEQMLSDLWTNQSRIKLTRAKIVEERRVYEVRQETADRIANFDEEIARLENQFQIKLTEVTDAKAKVQKQADETIKALKEREEEMESLAKELEQAKKEQERIRQEGEEKLEALQQEHQKMIREMREESENQLTAKDRQIQSLKQEIQTLLMQLQDKRNRLDIKESDIVALETVLEEKESIIAELNRERASLRTLLGLSWKVLKKRFKKRVLRRDDAPSDDIINGLANNNGAKGKEEQLKTVVALVEGDDNDNQKNVVRSQSRKAR